MPPGRPSSYRPEFAEQARKYCLLGATNERLAYLFEVGTSTIDRWLVEHDDFRCAVKSGREMADAEVASSLFQRALRDDTTAAIFWLKNRQPAAWREKAAVELTGSGGGPLQFTQIERKIVRADD